MKGLISVFRNGLWAENPVFKLVLGLCPALAVTNTVANGFAMGLATSFVLIASEIVISLIRDYIPDDVRIPSFILVIVIFVTFTDYFLAAFFPGISDALSLFIPLIVTNCLILGRSEAFASRNPLHKSITDGIGMGVGFTWVLVVLSAIREILGMGTFLGIDVMGAEYPQMIIMILPSGAFLTLGLMVGIIKVIDRKVGAQND